MLNILLFEDNTELGFMMRNILHWRGYGVEHGLSGGEGLALLAKATPDLIICDVYMPDMTGYEVLTQVRADERWAHIPFVMMSAGTSEEELERALEQGANGVLSKPFGLKDLDAVIAACGLNGPD